MGARHIGGRLPLPRRRTAEESDGRERGVAIRVRKLWFAGRIMHGSHAT